MTDFVEELQDRLDKTQDSLAEYRDAKAKIAADQMVAEAELAQLNDTYASLLMEVALGQKPAADKKKVKARILELEDTLWEYGLVLPRLERGIDELTIRENTFDGNLRRAQWEAEQEHLDAEIKRLDAEGVDWFKIMKRLSVSEEHLAKAIPMYKTPRDHRPFGGTL